MKKLAMMMALAAVVGTTAYAADNVNPGSKPGVYQAKRGGEARMDNREGLPRGFAKLNLSETQKQKIKAILDANQAQNAKNAPPHGARMAQHDELLTASTFDEAKARQMIQERQQRNADRELQHLKTQHAIFQVLTPEQQKQWQEQRRARGGDKGGRFQRATPPAPAN